MTSEDYLKARGWGWYDMPDGDIWLDPLGCVTNDDDLSPLADAVAIQVRRDRDCSAFVAGHGCTPVYSIGDKPSGRALDGDCPACKGTGDTGLNQHERQWDECHSCDGSGIAKTTEE